MKQKVKFVFLLSIILCLLFLIDSQFTKTTLTHKDFIQWRIEKKKNQMPNYGFPDKAMKMDYEKRAYPLGFIPTNWRSEALNHIKKNNILSKTEAENFVWEQVGPGNIPGRTRSILIDPQNPDIIYSGSVSGGVWKTTDGGLSWFALKDNMENLAISTMVLDPNNSQIIYAGTGEGYFNTDQVRGEGIFKTINGGVTWSRLSSTFNEKFYYINKLVIDKTTNILWAATRKGLYFSRNGGIDFSAKLEGQSGGDVHCMDVEIAYTNPTSIYVSFGQLNESVIYKSNNSGDSFSLNYNKQNHGRIEIAVCENQPNYVYASFCNLETMGVGHMAHTTNGGTNWTSIKVPGPTFSGSDNYAGTQAWYDNILMTDPDNPNIIYAGGIDFWKSTDAGNSWLQKTNWYETPEYEFAHADHHAIITHPTNPNILFLGTDGGIFKSTDKGETWNDLHNGLFTTQFYYGAVDPIENKFYGGTQDNGTIKTDGSNDWYEILSGDGGVTEVDFENPNTVYMEYVHLCIFKSIDGGKTFSKAMNGIPNEGNSFSGALDRSLFIAPFSMDPNNSKTLIAGTYRIYKTTNGAANWSLISGDLTGDGTGENGAYISALTIANGNSNVIYAGCSNGKINVTTNGGSSWNLRNSNLPNAFCSRIASYPNDPASAVAVFSGFLENQKVYRTTNYGVSWTNISTNLPNIPINCVFIDPYESLNIFIGTDLGVFYTSNGGSNWTLETNLPNVRTDDLDFRIYDNKLFAATHGRSMFAAKISESGSALASTNVDKLDLALKPNQSVSTNFLLSNNGTKNLSFTIDVEGGFENNSWEKLSLAKANKSPKKIISTPNSNIQKNIPPQILGNDLLILDDGNPVPDAFIGYNYGMDFGWANKFNLTDNGFDLEGFRAYIRTEDAFSNTIHAAVLDGDLDLITEEYFYFDLSENGKWFDGKFTNSMHFNKGQSFYIFLETYYSWIDFPAGLDYFAQISSNSFYKDYSNNTLINLVDVSGYENAAFLIRAEGTLTQETNQNPVAVANISTNTASIGELINFDASESYDNDGQITNYSWNFGDGATSEDQITDHSYSQKGTYTFSLKVTDDNDSTDQTTGQIIVKDTTTYLSVLPQEGIIEPGNSISINVKFNSADLPEGNYSAALLISSNGGVINIPVNILVSSTVDMKEQKAIPSDFVLYQNYPNPFNPSTVIKFSIPKTTFIKLEIFDISGKKVSSIVNSRFSEGVHNVIFDGSRFASGVYIYRITADKFVDSKKFILIK